MIGSIITDNAPAVLLLNLAEGLTEEEKEALATEQAKTPKNDEDKQAIEKKINDLIKKRSAPNETKGFSGWIPVPLLGSEIIPFLPESYNASVVKRIETVGGDVVMSSSMATSTINIKTKSNDLVNTIINACQLIYSMDDSFARIAFFSPELIVNGGVFVSMVRSVNLGQTEEQIISITVQNGSPKENYLKQIADKKPESIALLPVDTPIINSRAVTRR